jgi:hypothetical protein
VSDHPLLRPLALAQQLKAIRTLIRLHYSMLADEAIERAVKLATAQFGDAQSGAPESDRIVLVADEVHARAEQIMSDLEAWRDARAAQIEATREAERQRREAESAAGRKLLS